MIKFQAYYKYKAFEHKTLNEALANCKKALNKTDLK